MTRSRDLDLPEQPHPMTEEQLDVVTGGRWVKLGELQQSYRKAPANVQPLLGEALLAVLP
jgi:hypothetical protein